MPNRTWRGTIDSNWGTAGNWLEGAVPLVTDDVIFDAVSPNCTTTGNRVGKTLTMTAYTNTLTIDGALQISGNVTLGAATTLTKSGTGNIQLLVAGTLTSNGCVWSGTLSFTGIGTYTLTDNWTIGTYSQSQSSTGGGLVTINGFKIFILNSMAFSGGSTRNTTGTTVFEFTGALDGTIGTSFTTAITSSFRNPIIINKSGGTLTFLERVYYHTGTFTWTAGTVDTTTNNSQFICAAATTFNTSTGIVFNILQTGGTTTLTSDVYCTQLSLGATGTFAGAGKINGDWSVHTFQCTNTQATWTLTNSMTCVDAIFSQEITNFTFTGVGLTLSISGNITTHIGNSANFRIAGSVSLIYNGTGTWTGNSTLGLNMTINTAGTLTLLGMCSYGAATLTYTAGTVDSTTNQNSGLNIYGRAGAATTNLNLGSVVLENIMFSAELTQSLMVVDLTSTLNVTNFRCGNWGVHLNNATYGFICDNFICNHNYNTEYGKLVTNFIELRLEPNVNYVINESILISSDMIYPFNIKSRNTTPAKLTFNGTKQQVLACDVEYIDSSLGKTIWYDADAGTGTKSNTTNWSPLSNSNMIPRTVSNSF